jgi:hypothetical protein
MRDERRAARPRREDSIAALDALHARDDRRAAPATPAEWELAQAKGVVVEQIIRPTGLGPPRERPTRISVRDLPAVLRPGGEKG